MTCDQGFLEPQLKGQFIRSAGDKLDQQVMANALERCSQRHRVYLFDDPAIVGGGDAKHVFGKSGILDDKPLYEAGRKLKDPGVIHGVDR